MPIPFSRTHVRLLAPARAIAAAALAVVIAGCGIAASPQSSPSAAPSAETSAAPSEATQSLSPEELAALYAEIEEQVSALRGLEARTEVKPTIVDEAGMTDYAQRSLEKDTPPEYIAAYERFYKAMGQLEQSADLKAEYIRMLSSQALGVYDQDTKELYVVAKDGGVGPVQRATYAHEYDHALQDQHFDSQKLLLNGALDQGDQTLARLALLEGDAYVLMAQWVQQTFDQAELNAFMAESADPEAIAIMESIPQVIRDPLEFPATAGLLFVLDAYQRGGWDGVDALYEKPPDSTEQILHVDKYLAAEAPTAVALPEDLAAAMGDGWSESFQDSYGEFGLRQWLRQVINDVDSTDAAADVAAAGWGGDRVVYLEGPADAWAAAIVSEWDTPADADQFAAQAKLAVAGLEGRTSVLEPSDTRVVVLVASDDAALAGIAGGLGVAG